MYSAVRGVCSAGLITTVFPQLSAGAIFHININKGKFHCRGRREAHVFTQKQTGYTPNENREGKESFKTKNKDKR